MSLRDLDNVKKYLKLNGQMFPMEPCGEDGCLRPGEHKEEPNSPCFKITSEGVGVWLDNDEETTNIGTWPGDLIL